MALRPEAESIKDALGRATRPPEPPPPQPEQPQ